MLLHIGGLLLPGVALVSQRHLLVVTVRNNTGEEKDGEAFLKAKTNPEHKHQFFWFFLFCRNVE